jgi:LPS-assembly lipoprotein
MSLSRPEPRAQAATRRRRVLRWALASSSGLALGACGFELRRSPKLAFGSIALAGFAPRSALAEELRRQLSQQVQILPGPDKADVVLQALDDLREKSVVASTAAAQVREFTLRVRFNFRAATAGGRELIPRVELMLSRDLSYSEVLALAKEQEEAELYREMQSDIVAQVMRRLAVVRV